MTTDLVERIEQIRRKHQGQDCRTCRPREEMCEECAADRYANCIYTAASDAAFLLSQVDHWRANHADIVRRAALLSQGLAVALQFKLLIADIGSCNCLTKTPEAKYHAATCPHRHIQEALDLLDTRRGAKQPATMARSATLAGCNRPLRGHAALTDQTDNRDDEILRLHRELAAARLDAQKGWERYESANKMRQDRENKLADAIGEIITLRADVQRMEQDADGEPL